MNLKFYKRIPTKQMILCKPKEIYTIYLTLITIKLINNKKYLYFKYPRTFFKNLFNLFNIDNKKEKIITD